ncbi:hypothetical protein GU243_19585 [Pseudarthrobacter psychrotolerans]|uniref:Uncharacterized protein n=1 Tax=Pseudarthrobacter psychrotolerans TaxID=2697569 RepID=A0A6P1NVK0_9MICC|nr:hypothetical protein [Pseudarthrobacter psychrotolerans]QHK21532.1 hypothetical protein GU243_19585 [Pseudarthrobacter psychrotolerans]
MMKELTIQELESQQVELLPSRETLFLDTNWAGVYATNTSLALNAGSLFATANSAAVQTILVAQG